MKSNPKLIAYSFLLCVLSLLLLTQNAFATHPVDVFGPKTFVRTTGVPNLFQESFNLPTLLGTFTINVESNKVSSASIKLNGNEIFSPKDFNQNVSFLTKQVSPVLGNNTLDVKLASQPASSLKITITFLSPVKVIVTSEKPEVTVKKSVKFNAVVSGTSDQRVIWSVLAEGDSSAGFGSIDSRGLYTAPDSVPALSSVTIQAQSVANPYEVGTAVVTIKNPTVTGTISPQGGTVTLEGYATVIFPAGAFTVYQNVIVSATSFPETGNNYRNDTPGGPRLPYEIRINSGLIAPATGIDAVLYVPDAFLNTLSQNAEIEVFADMTYSTQNELLGGFEGIAFTYDPTTKSARVTLPEEAFTNLSTLDGTYEAVIIIGTIFK